ncbi:MAG: peptidylprolyl isomerase [Candidatus Latescibacterota bacterium]
MRGGALALPLLLAGGCGPAEEPGLVARVFGRPITAERYTAFVTSLPEGLRSRRQGYEARLEELQSLVDRELLVHEARQRGLEGDRELLRRLRRLRHQAVLQALHRAQGRDTLRVSEEEARQYFHATGRDREVRLAFLQVPTRQEALEAWRRVRAGSPFAAVAGSRLQSAGERYYNRDTIHPRLGETVFALGPGQVSEPIPYKPGYLLVQVVEERPADFRQYRAMAERHALAARTQAKDRDLAQALQRRYAPRLDSAGLARLASQAASAPDGAAIDTGTTVCTFAGGRMTAGQVVDEAVSRDRHGVLADAARLAEFVREAVLPQALELAEAERLGLAGVGGPGEEEVDRLLVDELLLREVKSGPRVSAQEARAYFEEHPEEFSPEFAEVQEILVATRPEAQQIADLVGRDPALDVAALAEERTLRPQGRGSGGRFHFHVFERPTYGSLVDAAHAAPLHQLQGPVAVDGGYSVFWVLRREQLPVSYDDPRVQSAARYLLTHQRQSQRFDAFVAGLRNRYGDQVRLYRRNLRRADASTGGEAAASPGRASG